MAFGAGSEIAHQAVRGMMGSGSGHEGAPAPSQEAAPPATYQQEAAGAPPAAQPMENPCMQYNQGLLQCLKQHNEAIGNC